MQQKNLRFLGKNVNYFLSGSGDKNIILLHGFLESSCMWHDYTSRWNKNYKVIAIDLPGHGKTDSLAEVNSTLLMADAVDAVLKAGFRTRDIADATTAADKILGTEAMGNEVLARL